MSKTGRSKVITFLLALVILAAVWILVKQKANDTSSPASSHYYHGVFRNKKDPNIWGDDNGKQVPPPPDAIPYDPNTKRDTSRPDNGPVKGEI